MRLVCLAKKPETSLSECWEMAIEAVVTGFKAHLLLGICEQITAGSECKLQQALPQC